ncbi:hypothetical protein BDV96DRAFT_650847 [Lophiotrema nucula]|uniref:Uncharacterized protein n=1 Tax=Lophiotrema nucula TaxID=690887 RepID=A0A6A5YVE4_9PLEO|nr:hypothetical protein BDV96DRAFT_650847 [Lophiotrema nucula]
MSEIETSLVKRGKWTNLQQGPVMGQTITTDAQTGTLIIALLAVFTSLGLTHLFHLFTFLYHQLRANGQPADGLFRQQQALLRTLPGPSSLASGSITLWLSWNHVSQKTLARSSWLAIVALVFALASVAASIFSSSVVTTTNLEVLVKSPLCTYLETGGLTNADLPYITTVYTLARAYADDCYTDQTHLPIRCKAYIRPRLDFSTEFVPCPFDNDLCASPALAFDSGLVDLGVNFGLNTAPRDRVRYRRRTTAAILSPRVKLFNASDIPKKDLGRAALPSEEMECYAFGSRGDGTPFTNCTFLHSLTSSNLTMTYTTSQATRLINPNVDQYFEPLPEMRREDADITVRAVGKNAIRYREPVDDLLFAAHQVVPLYLISDNSTFTYYQSDTHSSMIGIMEQYQYCITNSTSHETCSDLGGWPGTNPAVNFPRANGLQLSMLRLLYTTANHFNHASIDRFKASELIHGGGLIDSLPEDQWITELTSWESQIWAAHQIAMADYAAGPTSRVPSAAVTTRNSSTAGDKELCGMQKMRKTGDFININYFGLVFILTVSSVIAVVDTLILRFLIFLKAFKHISPHRINRWIQDGVWQLQRHAYESHGEGDWTMLDEVVPTTRQKTMLSDLPTETLCSLKSS